MKPTTLFRWLGLWSALLLLTVVAVDAQHVSAALPLTPVTERLIEDITYGPSVSAARMASAAASPLEKQSEGQSFASARSRKGRNYFVTDIGTLGGSQSFAFGINDGGQVYGYSWLTGDATAHPFLYDGRTMSDLGELVVTFAGGAINNAGQIATAVALNGITTPAVYDSQSGMLTIIPLLGGVSSFGFGGVATAINNFSEVVGYSYIDAITPHAFSYDSGMTTDLGSFGGSSYGLSINDPGIIVGSSTGAANGNQHAFVRQLSGQMKDIDPFGDPGFTTSWSVAADVNISGKVVGYFLTPSGGYHAFLHDGVRFKDISLHGNPDTEASSINNQGSVVGVHIAALDRMHAFLYRAGRFNDLNELIPSDSGWELTWAFDINNSEQIVGYGLLNNNFRAFLLTPAISDKQCKNGAWKKLGFKNQGSCIRFVNN